MPEAPTTVVAIDLSNATRQAEPNEQKARPAGRTPRAARRLRQPHRAGQERPPNRLVLRAAPANWSQHRTPQPRNPEHAAPDSRGARSATTRRARVTGLPRARSLSAGIRCRPPYSFFHDHDHQTMINIDQDQLLAALHDHQA